MKRKHAFLGFTTLALITLGPDDAWSEPSGTVTGTVTLTKGGAARPSSGGVVIYIESAPVTGAARRHAIHQKELQFDPPVNVVMKGTTVDFPNDDRVFHNVFSVSQPARFDLGLYKAGESKSVVFNRTGVVDIYCNIHPDMASKVKVVDTPYFAMTRADGTFEIGGVPPGTYPIVAWQAFGEEWRGQVIVTAGGRATVTTKLEEGQRQQRHVRKDGTPYGRYQ